MQYNNSSEGSVDLPSMINYAGVVADAVVATAPKIVAGCSVLAAFLPPQDGNGFLARLHRAVNLVAFNFNRARNAQ